MINKSVEENNIEVIYLLGKHDNEILFKDINLQLLNEDQEEISKNNLADLSASLKIGVYGKI